MYFNDDKGIREILESTVLFILKRILLKILGWLTWIILRIAKIGMTKLVKKIKYFIIILVFFSCNEISDKNVKEIVLRNNVTYNLTFNSYIGLIADIMYFKKELKKDVFYSVLLNKVIENSLIRSTADGVGLDYSFNEVFIYILKENDVLYVYIMQADRTYKKHMFPELNSCSVPESFYLYFTD